MKSVLLITAAFLLTSCASAPVAEAAPTPQPTVIAAVAKKELTQEQRFAAWKVDFMDRAIAKNYAPELVRSVISPAVINPLSLERDANQPEFTKPVWSYVDGAASNARIEGGRNKMTEVDPVLDTIEGRYQVPREVLTTIWGLETSYGCILGKHDICLLYTSPSRRDRQKSRMPSSA